MEPLLSIALRLPDGEELRGPLDRDCLTTDLSGLDLPTYGGMVWLGDLPNERQGIPIYTRGTWQELWTGEMAYWDPDRWLRLGGSCPHRSRRPSP